MKKKLVVKIVEKRLGRIQKWFKSENHEKMQYKWKKKTYSMVYGLGRLNIMERLKPEVWIMKKCLELEG